MVAAPAGEVVGPLSHRLQWNGDVVQGGDSAGRWNLGPGYLQQELLPVDLLAAAYESALTGYGAAALGYGADAGARTIREHLAARAARADGLPCAPEQVVLTAGTTQALYLICTALAAKGSAVLVDEASYDIGRRLFTECGLRLRTVPADDDGMDPAELRAAIRAERGNVGFCYLNPTFHNPTGIVLSERRRADLLTVARQEDVLVVEDDAYHELRVDDRPLPPSMAGLADYRGVLRLGSFSKTLGPGLRLGWLLTDAALARRLVGRAVFASGGCLNHTTALAVGTLLADGYDRHLHWLRAQLLARRDALVTALRTGLRGVGAPDAVRFERPEGGFFLWLRMDPSVSEQDLVHAAEQAGVLVAPGSRFGGGATTIRLAYSFNSVADLTEAGARLVNAWRGLSSSNLSRKDST